MKNVKENQLKKCIFLTQEEFDEIIVSIFGVTSTVTYTSEGVEIYVYGDCLNNNDIHNALAGYFDVSVVTSFHIDDCDYIGVWIVYKENETTNN